MAASYSAGVSPIDFEEIDARWREVIEARIEESCSMSGLLRDMVAFHLGTG